jgi:DNA repair protein RadD
MIIELRQYQIDAVNAVYNHLANREDNPCVVIPTAGGKSLVLAQIACDAVLKWNSRVMVLAHVKELLEQNAQKIKDIAPELPMGIYSAGLGCRDTLYPCTVAGIQSVYERPDEFGTLDLAIIDEAHLLTIEGEGMYRRFLKHMKEKNPSFRIIGLTATPYRMGTGYICKPENLLNHICYEVSVRTLVEDGFICNLRSKGSVHAVDTSYLHIRGGEFIQKEVDELMDEKTLVNTACKEIFEKTKDRNSVLIFCSGIEHAEHVCETINRIAGQGKCATVFGNTLPFDRDQVLKDFRERRLKFLANVNVLTTGFDAPCIDCVVLLRPTMSPGLYYQMVGRSFRLYEGKSDALILDYGGNVLRHGPVDAIQIEDKSGKRNKPQMHECPDCHEISEDTVDNCPDCGKKKDLKHSATAAEDPLLSKDCTPVDTEYEVVDCYYSVHTKKNAPPNAPQTLKVEYRTKNGLKFVPEWVCIEHQGYALEKAQFWWKKHSNMPMPKTAAQAVLWKDSIAKTLKITVRHIQTEKFDRIINRELAEIPPPIETGDANEDACLECGCPDSFEDDRGDAVCSQCGKVTRKASPFASAEKNVPMNNMLDIPESEVPF